MLRFFFTPPAKAFCSARQRTRAIAAHQTPFPSLPSSHHTIIHCAPTPVRVPPCHPRGLPPAHPHLARGSMAKDAVPPRLPSSETPGSSSSAAALAVAVAAVNSSRERTSPTQNEPHRPSATRPKEPNNPVPIVSRTHTHAVRVAVVRSTIRDKRGGRASRAGQGKIRVLAQPGRANDRYGTCSREQKENDA